MGCKNSHDVATGRPPPGGSHQQSKMGAQIQTSASIRRPSQAPLTDAQLARQLQDRENLRHALHLDLVTLQVLFRELNMDEQTSNMLARSLVANGVSPSSLHRHSHSHSHSRRTSTGSSSSTTANPTVTKYDPNSLPIFLSSGSEECEICLEDVTPNLEFRTLPCMHHFHRECIDRWLAKNPICPSCLLDLTKVDRTPPNPEAE